MAVDHAMIRQLTRIARWTGFSVATGNGNFALPKSLLLKMFG